MSRAYNMFMLRSSLPLARILGVEVRAHVSLLLLLFASVAYSIVTSSNTARGLGLWLTLLFAVLVREGARTLAAVYAGLPLRGILLLPIGGVFALAPSREGTIPQANRAVTLLGPLANLFIGLLLLGMVRALAPEADLLSQPWISTHHVLRSMVWMQLLLGTVGLLPPNILPARAMRSQDGELPVSPAQSRRAFANLGGAVGVLLLLMGFAFMSLWVIVLGSAFVFTAQVRGGSPAGLGAADDLLAREAMQSDYAVLSSSDTFGSALERVTQSFQDNFLVLRGDQLVGTISRAVLTRRLRFEGDGYLQGAMNRTLEVADPTEPVAAALRRATLAGAGDVVPVVQNGAVLGILTQQSLLRALQGRRTRGVQKSSGDAG